MEHDHALATHRIEAFSDGVFAIIVTLLVLDLKVPDAITPDMHQTMLSLWKLAPQFISFCLSFFIICIFWVNHHQFFSILKYANRKLLWLNNILLFWLCFVPFPTAFLGRNPTNIVAAMLFGSVLCLAAASFSLMSYYAMFGSDIADEHVNQREKVRAQRRSYFGIALYALSVVAAPFSVWISLVIFFIVPVYYFVPQRIQFV